MSFILSFERSCRLGLVLATLFICSAPWTCQADTSSSSASYNESLKAPVISPSSSSQVIQPPANSSSPNAGTQKPSMPSSSSSSSSGKDESTFKGVPPVIIQARPEIHARPDFAPRL